jgi:hypothetical protein
MIKDINLFVLLMQKFEGFLFLSIDIRYLLHVIFIVIDCDVKTCNYSSS